jgi:hypothetical protein
VDKQSLFISYCWKDGNTYADELETQLKEEFNVQRDKSQLIANDDIYDFMVQIANCDNVIIVLTEEYVKSLNCMLEMSFLVSQEDWPMKAMVLVIDNSLYSIERKLEIINYWLLRQKTCIDGMRDEERNYIDQICEQVEKFLRGLSRRKNPSQIAVVNEVIKKSKRNRKAESDLIARGEAFVKDYISKNGNITLKELAEASGRSSASVRRMISDLLEKGCIEKVGVGKEMRYIVVK